MIKSFLDSGCLVSVGNQELWVGWGTPERCEFPNVNDLCIYAPDFFLKDSKPWWCFRSCERIEYSKLVALLKNNFKENGTREENTIFSAIQSWENPNVSFFEKTFGELQRLFAEGTLKKGVPFVFEKAQWSFRSDQLGTSLCKMLQAVDSTPLYPYGLWNSEEGILGASPEILFSQESSEIVRTMALAGTRSRFDFSTGSLKENSKEIQEHNWVIQGISKSLSPIGDVMVGETQEVELPTLVHLLTPIQVKLSSEFSPETFEALVEALHPTPALGAFPKDAGQRWLESYEKELPRYRFGAPFGAIWKGERAHCLVAIRNFQWKQKTLYLGAGCGVISQSQCSNEWREIQSKLNATKRVFL